MSAQYGGALIREPTQVAPFPVAQVGRSVREKLQQAARVAVFIGALCERDRLRVRSAAELFGAVGGLLTGELRYDVRSLGVLHHAV